MDCTAGAGVECPWSGACVGVGIADWGGRRCANDYPVYGAVNASTHDGFLDISFDVRKTASWGGWGAVSQTWRNAGQAAPWDCTNATHISFRYYTAEASSSVGHLRVNLFDDDLNMGSNVDTTQGSEVYYSFHYGVIDRPMPVGCRPENGSCWRERLLPLVGSASWNDPFVQTGWSGVNTGDSVLDKSRIYGW